MYKFTDKSNVDIILLLFHIFSERLSCPLSSPLSSLFLRLNLVLLTKCVYSVCWGEKWTRPGQPGSLFKHYYSLGCPALTLLLSCMIFFIRKQWELRIGYLFLVEQYLVCGVRCAVCVYPSIYTHYYIKHFQLLAHVITNNGCIENKPRKNIFLA